MNKTNKTFNNLFFIFASLIILFCICFFNYKIDPYKLFGNKNYMQLYEYPLEMIYTVMKIYKNNKYDTVIIGGSDAISLFDDQYKQFFNNLSIPGINYKQYRELLEAYLKLHPETKKVIIVISYDNLIKNMNIYTPEFDKSNLTIKEYQRILFSADVTIKSLELIKNKIINKVLFYLYRKKQDSIFIEYNPKNIDFNEIPLEELKEIEKNNLIEMKKIIKILNNKNLDYVFIISPYHILYNSVLHEHKYSQDNIDNFKRFIVNNVPPDKKIYDFAFVNKYTSSDISTNKDALYINITHPSFIYGTKIIKVLFNDIEADKSIYFLLNKNNIESVIEKENKLIEDYINNNLKLVKYYQKLALEQNEDNILFIKKLKYESLSDESKKEYEYLIRKINNYKKK